MARLFGTDGVRGVANKELTCETAFKLGQAAVAFQGKTILIGKDTRLSGDMLESAVASGIMSMGGTALLAGIIPTPAIALLVRELHCDGGIVISASHNPRTRCPRWPARASTSRASRWRSTQAMAHPA